MITADDSNDCFADWAALRQEVETLMTPEARITAALSVDPSGMSHEELADYLDLIDSLSRQRITPEEKTRRLTEIKRRVNER